MPGPLNSKTLEGRHPYHYMSRLEIITGSSMQVIYDIPTDSMNYTGKVSKTPPLSEALE